MPAGFAFERDPADGRPRGGRDDAAVPRMSWDRLLDDTRFGDHPRLPGIRVIASRTDLGRSEFQKDHDRLLFSEAFRKLGRKTQVHPLPDNDRVHNRLTHSLEVSCVGRSLGELVGKRLHAAGDLPDGVVAADVAAVVQAACLAHDIGNPPFGHAGEFAVRDWYRRRPAAFFAGVSPDAVSDLQTFEGNAQGFRLLTTLSEQSGLRLTYATLGAFIKYPWSSVEAPRLKPGKFSFFRSEAAAFETIVASMGLLPIAPGIWCRHPLTFLVEAADDICYAIIDIEDGVEMSLLHMRDAEDLLLSFLPPSAQAAYDEQHRPVRPEGQRLRWLRGRAMDGLIEDCVDAFFREIDAILEGRFTGSLVDIADPRTAAGIGSAKSLARTRIFTHTRKMEIEVGAYATVETLLDASSSAVRALLAPERTGDAEISYRASRILGLMGDAAPPSRATLEAGYRLVNDFLSGLTDNRATELARVIRGRD